MKFDDCKAKLLGPQRWCMLPFNPKRVLHCTITFKLLNTVQDIVHELASYWSLPIWLPQVLQLSSVMPQYMHLVQAIAILTVTSCYRLGPDCVSKPKQGSGKLQGEGAQQTHILFCSYC